MLSSGGVNDDGTVQFGTEFTASKTATGVYQVTFDNALKDNNYAVTALDEFTPTSASLRILRVTNKTTNGFTIQSYQSVDSTPVDGSFNFTVTGTETIAVGGSGGSYTPEPMVWEDKTAERAYETVYTNTNDVPIYVNISSGCTSDGVDTSFYTFNIDGVAFNGGVGGLTTMYDNSLYIVPSGSTYMVDITRDCIIYHWQEAKMPVAVGTGGKTVAFRGELSANQTITTTAWAKVNLDTSSIDTDSAFVDGTFKPSVAGYYQVNGSVFSSSTVPSVQTASYIFKNGTLHTHGTSVKTSDGTATGQSTVSNVNDVIYLNGTTDYVELWGFINSLGTCIIDQDNAYYLPISRSSIRWFSFR